MVKSIIIPIIVLLFTWLATFIYNKFILIRPKLYLHLGKAYYEQHFLGFDDFRHSLKWRHDCILKNNSEYTAYNIEIYEVINNNSKNIIDNIEDLKRMFPQYNHLDKNGTKEFEIKTEYITKPDELLNSFIENGIKVIRPGLKNSKPGYSFQTEGT